jgi:hypothetical protein
MWGFTHEDNLYDLHNVNEDSFPLGPGELRSDPLFADPLTDDFHIQAGSPAIDSGQALGYPLDFEDHPVPAGAAPDLGAYEFATTTFVDVPPGHAYYDEIEWLYRNGYTAGCSTNPLMYCPEATMNRAESSVFVERGIHTASYEPPAPTSQVFADMPLDSWAAKWVNGLWGDQYTAGCGTSPLMYCPWQGHTRAEGAVFYLRMLRGANYEPPSSQGLFADVPSDAWYGRWVEEAYRANLIEPCGTGPLRYCPMDPLTRAVAAYMMARAKQPSNPVPTPTPTQIPGFPPPQYSRLVFADEFNGTAIDGTKWEVIGDDVRRIGWWFADFALLDGQGHLLVKTDKKPGAYHWTQWGDYIKNEWAPAAWGDFAFGSGAIRTRDRFYHSFGYYEARVQFLGDRTAPGHWPAFWIYDDSVNQVGNEGRDGTEIDIFEYWETDNVTHALHWDGYGSAHEQAMEYPTTHGMDYGWHVFGLLWTPTEYVFYLDGVETWRTNAGGVSQVQEYMKITDEIELWYGDVNRLTDLPHYTVVDYVRAYGPTIP